MIQQNKIIGHSEQINILQSNYKKNFPHAWIFNGIKGIGKYSTAINFIRSVNNKKLNYEQYLFEINLDDNLALIEDIRNIINQAHLTNANKNEKCFILIDNSDSLNFNSYNALLKTIEEPPENTILIIICHNLNKLPKTIQSRCIRLDFKPLSKTQINEFCLNNKIVTNEFDLEKNYNLFNGSIQKFLLFASEEGKFVNKYLIDLNKKNRLSITEFEKFYEQVSGNYEKYFKIIINYMFAFQKRKYIKHSKNKLLLKKILFFFSNIEVLTKQDLNIEKKKELFFLLSEYIKTNTNE